MVPTTKLLSANDESAAHPGCAYRVKKSFQIKVIANQSADCDSLRAGIPIDILGIKKLPLGGKVTERSEVG